VALPWSYSQRIGVFAILPEAFREERADVFLVAFARVVLRVFELLFFGAI
jgi:hypothetical protein